MLYTPQTYKIKDQRMKSFIDPEEIWSIIHDTKSDKVLVREVIQKSLDKKRLSLEETAILLNATDPELIEDIKEGART